MLMESTKPHSTGLLPGGSQKREVVHKASVGTGSLPQYTVKATGVHRGARTLLDGIGKLPVGEKLDLISNSALDSCFSKCNPWNSSMSIMGEESERQNPGPYSTPGGLDSVSEDSQGIQMHIKL